MSAVLLNPEHRWECPNCDLEEVTREANPHTRMHTCPGAKYMTVPMIPAGLDAKVELQVREDYIGEDVGNVQLDEDGTPWMAAVTTREDGQDVAIYATTASR